MDKQMTKDDFMDMNKKTIVTFLRDNRQKISGNKRVLVDRAFEFHQLTCAANESLTSTRATIGSDRPISVSTSLSSSTNIPEIAELNSGWTSSRVDMPSLVHKDVETYLLHSSQRTGDEEKMKCYRQFIRGYNFFKENYIHKIMANNIEDESRYCYVRSKCFPSMKQGTYTQWILMTKQPPHDIMQASCTCPAGLGEGCAHIAALLFALEEKKPESEADLACTSKPCEWSKPGKRKREPSMVQDINFKKIKYGDENENRHIAKREMSGVNCENVLTTLTGKLNRSAPIALFDLLPQLPPIPYEDVASDLNVCHFEEVSTCEIIEYESDEYINLNITLDKEELSEKEFVEKFGAISSNVINEIESRTVGQANNELWHQAREKRITATSFHDVSTKKTLDNESCTNLASRLCLKEKQNVLDNVAAINTGRKHEKIALKKYIAYKKLKCNEKVTVQECGIFLSKDFGFLGASPDGICPSSYRTRKQILFRLTTF